MTEGTTAGKGTLWDKFIDESIQLLNEKGLLCFITPSGWRKPEHKLYKKMTSDNQLLYLHIYGQKKTKELFHVSARVDLYVIEIGPRHKNTAIIDENGDKHNIDLKDWNDFLPNYYFTEIQHILTSKEKGIKVIYNTAYHSNPKECKTKFNKEGKYIYPVVHAINQKGLEFIYANDNDKEKGHFGIPKVILNKNGTQYTYPEQNDHSGKYGMSEVSFGIPIKNETEGDLVLKALETPKFKEIILATRWMTAQIDYRMFKYFKPDFYKYFLREGAGKKNKQFITKKHQERKNKTKKSSPKSGGTRKRNRTRQTKKYYFW